MFILILSNVLKSHISSFKCVVRHVHVSTKSKFMKLGFVQRLKLRYGLLNFKRTHVNIDSAYVLAYYRHCSTLTRYGIMRALAVFDPHLSMYFWLNL